MKNIFVILLFTLTATVLFAPALQSQSIAEDEQILARLETEETHLCTTLDSLRLKLDVQLDEIDRKKTQKNPPQSEISHLMAQALSATQTIEAKRLQLGIVSDSLLTVKAVLHKSYTRQIDQLNKQISSELNSEAKLLLEESLLTFVEKRMAVSPISQKFSFDPKKVQTIRVSAAQDSFERTLYINYLQQALDEVDSQLRGVEEKQREVEGMIRLEEKASDFLDDIADNRVLALNQQERGSVSASPMDHEGTGIDVDKDFFSENRASYSEQVNQYSILLGQLRASGLNLAAADSPELISGSTPLTYAQLVKKLEAMRQYLRQYRQIISERMK